MKKFLIAGLLAAILPMLYGRIICLRFDGVNPLKHTVAGYGRTMRQADRALVLAKVAAQDFTAEKAPGAVIPTADFRIRLKNFPAAGYLDLYAMPFFNGKAPYPLTALTEKGKEVLNLTLDDKKLTVTVNGKSTAVDTSTWAVQHYRHIQLVWDGKKTRIFMERKECAVVPESPRHADHAVIFAGFQGLVDEFCIGRGMPLTIDPEFDGDPAKFPEIKPSGNMLDAASYRLENDRISVAPCGKGVRFSWAGFKSGSPVMGHAANGVTYDVVPGGYIRVDISWQKLSWNHGSLMGVRLFFTDASGKIIVGKSIDARSDIKGYVFPMSLSEFYTEAGIGVPMSYFNYFRVPEKAVKVFFRVGFYGNPASVVFNKFAIRHVDPAKQPWFREPYDVQKIHDRTRLSDEQVAEVLKKRPRVQPELRRVGDRVEIFVNGKLTPCQIFVSPRAGDYRWINGFKAAGFPFYLSNVSLGRSASYTEYEPIWREDGTVDITPLKKAVYRVLRYNPDAMIFLGLSITPNRKWLEENKSELMVNQQGEYAVMRDFAVRGLYSKTFPDKIGHTWYPSTASLKYRADIAEVLRQALTEFEKSDAAKAVAGIYVLGGDDGQFRFPPLPDFSAPALNSYRNFLKSQGRKNWASAAMPDPENFKKPPFPPYGQSPVSDYQRWSTQESYALRQSMYNAVKSAMPRVLVGGYENAMGLTGQPGFGRYKIHQLLNSAVPEFLVSLPGYNRYRDDCDHPAGMKAYNGSMLLHKKLMIGEMDIRNPENGPLGINNRSRNYQATHNADTFRNFLALYSSYCISWGGGFHAYLMQPMWWNTERAVAAWKRAAGITRHAEGQELNEYRIAVFVDENSSYCHSTVDIPAFHSRIHYRESTQYALWRSGVRCDYYLPQDALHKDFAAPKILIFADAGTMTVETAAAIRRRFGRNGRIIIWSGHAGYLNEGKVETVEKITNFKLQKFDVLNKPLVIGNTQLWEPAFYAGAFPKPSWVVNDPAAKPIAYYADTKLVGLAMKKYPDHTEIYLGQPGSLSPAFVRELARKQGIIPVQDRNDLAVMGGGLLEIGAMTGAGVRRIYFPNGVKDLVPLTGHKILRRGKGFIEVDMAYKDAVIFKTVR